MTARARVLGDFRVLGEDEQDTTMEDTGEKGRPPGDPPDAPGSWVRKVVGSNVGGMPVPEDVVDEKFVESRLRLEFPNGDDGEPVITIGEEVLTAMNTLWKRCMIVKVLGRNVPLMSLTHKLKELWKPNGSMFVMDLPRNFFMVRFESDEEYMNALSGGPWRAFGSCLMVQAWTPDFDPLRDEIVTTPVWVRLSHIPVNFYHKAILMGIAKGLGRPIKVDLTTLKFERARFARIYVEVNLNKPLKGTVMINGERYWVSYEGISTICSTCGMYGHLAHACPKKTAARVLATVSNPDTSLPETTEDMRMETEFTKVRSSRKKTEQQIAVGSSVQRIGERDVMGSKIMVGSRPREVRNENVVEKVTVLNRFGGLSEEGVTENPTDDVERDDENKENENSANLSSAISSGVLGKNLSFAAKGVSGNQTLPRCGVKDKASGKIRGPSLLKPKSRNVGPTRGLVFGPTRGETGLSVSGKRLRVENVSVGRPGGVFAGVGELTRDEKDTERGGGQRKLQAQSATTEIPSLNDMDSQGEQEREVLEEVEA
ncbi:uncharacterized protein LOC125578102 [Brassica napus]|uniref:uncharacterized protein LOC125578102 n=1 Tax=Brassica napus TaxID=3708 RepID=UPI002078EF00|nr:uncharacterized protein LOC125578102 [Brassica napus]